MLVVAIDPWPSIGADTLAAAITERLGGRLRLEDGLFALTGGRFGVVALARHGEPSADALVTGLQAALDRPVSGYAVASAIGGVLAPSEAATADAAILTAHERAGAEARPSVGAEAERLRAAIAAGQLVLHYQPVVRLGDDRIPLVEALVRWDDPEHGLRPPADFIPLAEASGVIELVGAWALREAARQVRAWDDAGLPRVRCAVNLSARELCSEALPARVADALAGAGLTPDRLEVELTESMFADPESAERTLGRLRAMGVRVAIDDFGTGYSSLGYLTRFRVDAIKVDGAFVRRAAEDDDAAGVVAAICAIGRRLGVEVVAEGVETLAQLRFVQRHEVDLVQGWLFSEALPAAELTAWLGWAEERVDERDGPRVPLPPVVGARRRPSTAERALRLLLLLAGLVAGVKLGLPFTDVDASRCPIRGEQGSLACQVQKGWAPAATILVACVLAGLLASDLVLRLRRPRTGPGRDPMLLVAPPRRP